MDAWESLTGTTGDAWERLCGTTGDVWNRLPWKSGDAWTRWIAECGAVFPNTTTPEFRLGLNLSYL